MLSKASIGIKKTNTECKTNCIFTDVTRKKAKDKTETTQES